jgi:transcriptional regulator with XRE-family HTH domain
MTAEPNFADILREYRKTMKWTQDEIAEKWGYSIDTISAWERNVRRPKIKDLSRLAKLLDMDHDVLKRSLTETRGNNHDDFEHSRALKSSFDMWGDIQGIYRNRTEFNKHFSYPKLFEGAQKVLAVGISLNAIARNFDRESFLASVIDHGCRYELCFLEPYSTNCKERELEEGYDEDTLSDLTRINIRHMSRIRDALMKTHPDLGDHITLKTYNLAPRFNIYIVNDLMTVQCYAYKRGEDTPTFVVKQQGTKGLYDFYQDTVDFIRDKATVIPNSESK